MKTKSIIIGLFIGLSGITSSFAQAYNSKAGMNIMLEDVQESYIEKETGKSKVRIVKKEVESDNFGNAKGNQYDLAVDEAFKGQTIAVLHLYTGGGFDFELPKNALAEKGFSVYRWKNRVPPAADLKAALKKSCQLWIISGASRQLNEEHLAVIKDFFEQGKGIYIWGDNTPYYGDANFISKALIGTEMNGNTSGQKVVNLQMEEKKVGLTPNHLITTGIQNIYEGHTIATITEHKDLTPIIYGSANNLVTAVYEKKGRRLILDGGFTRLYVKWDEAGTGRYVKNAAAWLVNYERFGDAVVAND